MKVGDRVRLTDVCHADLRGRLGTVATLFNDADGFACIDIGDGGQAYGYPGHHFVLANEPPATKALSQVRCGCCNREIEIPCPCGAQPVYGGSPLQIVGWTPSSEYPKHEPVQEDALARALFDDRLEAEAMRIAEGDEAALCGPTKLGLVPPSAHPMNQLARVLDIMWEKTKPDVRAECEAFALRLVLRMGR